MNYAILAEWKGLYLGFLIALKKRQMRGKYAFVTQIFLYLFPFATAAILYKFFYLEISLLIMHTYCSPLTRLFQQDTNRCYLYVEKDCLVGNSEYKAIIVLVLCQLILLFRWQPEQYHRIRDA